MIASRSLRLEISRLLELAQRLTPVLVVMSVFALLFARAELLPFYVACFIAGACVFGLLLLSWRHHAHRWAIAIWALPAVTLGASVAGFSLPFVRAGSLHPLGALLAVFGLTGLGFFAPLVLFRKGVRRWFGL